MKFPVDELNDAELEKLSQVLALRKSIRAAQDQKEQYHAAHLRRCAALDAEITTTRQRIEEICAGGAS